MSQTCEITDSLEYVLYDEIPFECITNLKNDFCKMHSQCIDDIKKFKNHDLILTIDNSTKDLIQKTAELKMQEISLKELCKEREIKNKWNKDTNTEIENQINKLKKDMLVLETDLDNKLKKTKDIKKKGEPSQHDIQKLEMAKKKFSIFKEITGITFDYKSSDTLCVRGCIKNFHKSAVKAFEYKGNMNPEEISEKLWNKLTKVVIDTETNKENLNLKNQNSA